ncbi:MAG TPA: hypothetical protein VE843_16610 [Ktedonobacteraceae bacterium]|nr:hypothetical protein [Ktedonobacteraceae bacterium]
MDVIAQGMSTSHLDEFLSEHTLHGLTFLGILLVLLGFLYLSYDLLGDPRGILKGLLILFTHLVVSILVLAIFAPVMLFLFQQALRATQLPPNIVDSGQQIGDIVVYTLMIGMLQGTLIAIPNHGKTVKRFQWRDALIGFLFALVFFGIDEYVVFHTPINDVQYEIPDVLFFVFMGITGAGFWRRYGQGPHPALSDVSEEEEALHDANRVMQRKDEAVPSFFSLADFIRALLFWYIVGGLSIMLWAVLYILQFGLTEDLLFYVVDLFVGAAPASLICGSSQYITWKVQRLGEKQLGVIGATMSILGFSLSLIEPLVLFLTTH